MGDERSLGDYIKRRMEIELRELRRIEPDEETVRTGWHTAYEKYRYAVLGNGFSATNGGSTGIIIADYYAVKEAWKKYAEERKIELER